MATALRHSPPDPAEEEVAAFLLANERKTLLRFITCGSVDDGKSTLIGRLLHDSKMLLEDQLATLERDSRHHGLSDGELDFASLVNGLAAEREQGITIDVAYRFFATDKRKFIVADTPGHEQYTRNMVTGASTADLALILVDARKGVLTQTRRHSHIVNLLGIRHIVLVVNKMDLVAFEEACFERIVADYAAFAARAGIKRFTAIPLSGLAGDNVTASSPNLEWFRGPSLLTHLETVPLDVLRPGETEFRMPVQWVNRPNQDFRGFAGTVVSGEVRVGEPVRIEPSGRRSSIARLVTRDGDLPRAIAGEAVTLVLADEVDCSRGDMVVAADAEIGTHDHVHATLVWMAHEAMVPGRAYWLKLGTQTVAASVSQVHRIEDVREDGDGAARPLALNDIGSCDLVLDRPIPATRYQDSRPLGAFILIDRASHATVAAGMISEFPSQPGRSESGGNGGRVVWLVGSSPTDRLEFARRAQERLRARGRPTLILDSHAVRAGLSSDLGETEADEAENRRRTSEVARLMSQAGVVVLIALDVAEGENRPGTDLDVSAANPAWDWTI